VTVSKLRWDSCCCDLLGQPRPKDSCDLEARLKLPIVLRRCVVIGTLLAALLTVPAGAQARRPAASLRIRIDGAVGGARTSVMVRGPGGFQRVLARSQTLDGLRAGRYVLQAKSAVIARAVRGAPAGSELLPFATTIRVAVRRGKATTVKVRYATIIRKGVGALSVPPLQVLGSTQDPTGLVVGSSRAPRVGQILSEAPSTSLPGGLFDLVTAVSRQGAQDLISLRPATLTEAFPQLALNTSVPLQPITVAHASSALFESPFARAADIPGIDFSLGNGPASCGLVTGSLDPSLQISISYPFNPSLRVVLSAKGSLELDLATSSGMTCGFTLSGPAFQDAVPIGPVLVPVYGSLDLNVGGKLTAASNAGVELSVSAEGGLSYQHGHTSPILNASAQGHAQVGCLSGAIQLLPTLEAGIGVKDPVAANVHTDLSFGPELTPSAGGWRADALLQLTAGASIGPLTATLPALVEQRYGGWTGANSGCKGSGGGGGSGSGGGGSGGGGGGGGPGGGPGTPNPESDSSGLLDTGFGNGGQAQFAFPQAGNDTSASSVAVQPGGDILVAGTIVAPGGATQGYVSRFTTTGQIDASFGAGGTATVDESHENCFANGARGCVTTVIAGPEGKIYVAYCFADVLSVSRLDPNGSLDTGFESGLPGGLGCSSFYPQPRMQLDSLGRLIVLGTSPSGYVLVRLTPDGSLDEGFGEGGEAQVPFSHVQELRRLFVGGLAIQSDGTIAVGGSVRMEPKNPDEPETQCAYTVARVTESGQPDDTFGNGGRVLGPTITGLCGGGGFAGRPDGGYIDTVEAGSTSGTGGPSSYIYALTPTGELNVGFGSRAGWQPLTLGGAVNAPFTVIVTADNRVLIGGIAEDASTVGLSIERLTPEGSPDLSFGFQGISEEGCKSSSDHTTSSLAIGSDGSLVAAATEDDPSGVNACVARWSGVSAR
jgi:uncharacterized delta-60 repeat protein